MDDQRPGPRQGPKRRIPTGTLVAGGFFVVLTVVIVVALMSQTSSGSMPGMDMGDGAGDSAPSGNTTAISGMDMEPGGEMSGMDMRPVDVSDAPEAGPEARGNQPLEPIIAEDGTKEFELTAGVVRWNILPDVQVGAFAYNEQVSGPEIRVTQGDEVRIRFTNNLPEATSVHWHGLILPNAMDGASDVTQDPVEPGVPFDCNQPLYTLLGHPYRFA